MTGISYFLFQVIDVSCFIGLGDASHVPYRPSLSTYLPSATAFSNRCDFTRLQLEGTCNLRLTLP